MPTSVSAGQSISLSAQNSAAATGHTISTYGWANIGKQAVSIQNATSANATATAPSCGYATVQVTVTDEAGRIDTANVVLSPDFRRFGGADQCHRQIVHPDGSDCETGCVPCIGQCSGEQRDTKLYRVSRQYHR